MGVALALSVNTVSPSGMAMVARVFSFSGARTSASGGGAGLLVLAGVFMR